MNTPTQEQFQTVIDNLEYAFKLAGGNAPVSMIEIGVPETNVCGTPCCHGGWYAVALYKEQSRKSVTYEHGAFAMAHDLGFERMIDLQRWADRHPKIWGNQGGYFMFLDEGAFNDDVVNIIDKPISLLDIINHWKGVKERAAQHG